MSNTTATARTEVQWDKEFQSVEASLHSQSSRNTILHDRNAVRTDVLSERSIEQNDLARTAGLLVETIKDEQNPKFKNSQFLSLMRKLRDGDVVVNGEDLVERESMPSESLSDDVKGKGRERGSGKIK